MEISSTGGGALLGRTFGEAVPSNGTLWGSYVFSQQTVTKYAYGQDQSISGAQFSIGGGSQRQYFANAIDDSPYSGSDYADIGVYKNNDAYSAYPGSGSLTLGQNYFVVYNFQNIGYGNYSSNVTSENLWVLNQSNLATINGDFTVANLNANNLVDLSFTSSAGYFTFGTNVIDASSLFQLVGQAGTVDIGNVALGSTLADVASYGAVPEPSTWALISSGLIFLVLFQRKRTHLV